MDETKILITGAGGQLGKELVHLYSKAKAMDAQGLDITNKEQIRSFDWGSTEVIINAAAFTDVDGAETEAGRVAAWKVNAAGAAHLAEAAQKRNLTLVHVSTDYVFDGSKNPHLEDESFSPLSSYGASKAAGDIAVMFAPKHYLLRSSWVVGDGKNFVRTMLGLGKNGVAPKVVADQIGRPTFTSEIARAIDFLLGKRTEYGTYNMTNDGDPVSWADLTREIFKQAGFNLSVTDTTTADYFSTKPEAAKRPPNSYMDLTKIKAAGFAPREWRDDLKEYIKKEMETQA